MRSKLRKNIFILITILTLTCKILFSQEEDKMEKKVSLAFRDISLTDALKYIATLGELNFAIAKGVSGRVTLTVENVALKDAFDIILLSNELAYEKKGDIYYIMTAKEYKTLYGKEFSDPREIRIFRLKYTIPEKAFKVLDTLKSERGRVLVDEESGTVILMDTKESLDKMEEVMSSMEGGAPLEVFTLQYAKAKEVEEQLKKQLDVKKAGTVTADERSNQVIVQTLPKRMDDVREIIRQLDKKTKEVLIEARIIKVDLNKNVKFGISWEGLFQKLSSTGIQFISSHPYDVLSRTGQSAIDNYTTIPPEETPTPSTKSTWTGQVYFGQVGGTNQWEALLNFLQTYGDTKILSSPKLAVINNQEAKIHIGTREVYVTTTTAQAQATTTVSEEVHFIDVGIKLAVTPIINEKGFVTLNIKPEISSVIRYYKTPSGNVIPIVDTALAETSVIVKDGVTILIGGLRKEEKRKNSSGIPFLSRIPLLGKAFSDSEDENVRAELIVLLTPHIITGEEFTTGEEIPLKSEVSIPLSEEELGYRKYGNQEKK